MDTNYLNTLERELRAHNTQRGEGSYKDFSAELDAALKRGREYQAIALNLAFKQLMSRLKAFIQSAIRPHSNRKRHTPMNSPRPWC